MSFQIEGKLYRVFDTDQKTETFQARDFVIEKEDRGYTNYIKFQLTQDRCQLIDSYSQGEQIIVHFDLRGREWEDKFFTNLNAWKVERGSATDKAEGSADFPDAFDEFPDPEEGGTSSQNPADDDLPF